MFDATNINIPDGEVVLDALKNEEQNEAAADDNYNCFDDPEVQTAIANLTPADVDAPSAAFLNEALGRFHDSMTRNADKLAKQYLVAQTNFYLASFKEALDARDGVLVSLVHSMSPVEMLTNPGAAAALFMHLGWVLRGYYEEQRHQGEQKK